MSDSKYKAIGEIEDRVIEECSEVIKAICKANRFGLDGYHPDNPKRFNINDILDEMQDVRRVFDEYQETLLTTLLEIQQRKK